MKSNDQGKTHNGKPRLPMFESTWLALFLMLRHEWLQFRPSSK